MELYPFSCYVVFTKTLNLSKERWKLVYLRPISTRKNKSKDLWDKDIHTLQDGRNILCKFFIFMELYPFSYYFVITKKPNLSNVKYILAYLNKFFTHEKIPEDLWDNDIHTLKYRR